MLRITIELLPYGSEENKENLGVAEIINDGSGEWNSGNYDIRLLKSPKYAKRAGVWKKGRVEGFPRTRYGPWDLLLLGLLDAIGDRLPLNKRSSSDEHPAA